MYEITKDFSFSAAHQLEGLPEEHPCSRLHGHNYCIRLSMVAKELDSIGFVRDYRELDSFKHYIDDTLDHYNLNDVIPGNPTAERIAEFLFHKAQELGIKVSSISVSETPKTWARFTP